MSTRTRRSLGACAALVAGLVIATGPAVASTPPPPPLVGTASPDHLVGTLGADVIRGLAGADQLRGGPGADRIYGGAGDDRIDARDARRSDRLVQLLACLGASRLAACEPLPAAADLVLGGPGDDTIQARDGRPDAILCGPGRDTVVADATDLFSSTRPRSACETVLVS
jgi:Ca2+-binding RTX toxin-like protein